MSQLSGVQWRSLIYDNNGKEVAYFYTDSSEFAKKSLTNTYNLKKGTYYYYVNGSWNALWEPYSFSISMSTSTPITSNVVVTNNKGKNDTITVKGLVKGAVVRVYNASSKEIVKGTSSGTSLTLSYKQLGTKADKVYVTVQNPGYAVSNKVTISYESEISTALKTSAVKITNNKVKNDVVIVTGLQKGDVVKVYNAASKGKLLATSKKATSSSVTISIKQLGTKAGTTYVSVTKSGMKESTRTAVKFTKEK